MQFRFPEEKSNYIVNSSFKELIPYGTPFFEEGSALVSRKVTINQQFQSECVKALQDYNWNKYLFNECYSKIRDIYESYKFKDNLITNIESEFDYEVRVKWDIGQSKRTLEEKLGKNISHICWPHGDYNNYCHKIALEEGYRSSSIVLKRGIDNPYNDRFDRTGSSKFKENRFLTLLKAKYKVGSYRNQWPFNWVSFLYSTFTNDSKKN